jgi:hypothetical protein
VANDADVVCNRASPQDQVGGTTSTGTPSFSASAKYTACAVFTKLSAGDKTYIHNAAWFPLFSSPILEHHVRLYHAFCLDLICDQFFLVLALATPAHIEIDSLGFKPSFF